MAALPFVMGQSTLNRNQRYHHAHRLVGSTVQGSVEFDGASSLFDCALFSGQLQASRAFSLWLERRLPTPYDPDASARSHRHLPTPSADGREWRPPVPTPKCLHSLTQRSLVRYSTVGYSRRSHRHSPRYPPVVRAGVSVILPPTSSQFHFACQLSSRLYAWVINRTINQAILSN